MDFASSEHLQGYGKAVAGFLGAGSLWYSAGFLAIRSHHTFLGVQGLVPISAAEVSEEGARFFYHLVIVPVGMLKPSWQIVMVAVLLFLLWEMGLWRKLIRLAPDRIWEWTRKTRDQTSAVARTGTFLLLVLAACNLLLETVWKVVEYQDLLHGSQGLPEMLRSADSRSQLYTDVVARVAICALIGVQLLRCGWRSGNGFRRLLIAAQWLITIVAVTLLPVAYGRLILRPHYAAFDIDGGGKESRVLLGQSDHEWVIWNENTHKVEVIPKDKEIRPRLGPLRTLLE